MAAKNWRENARSAGDRPRQKKTPAPSSTEPLRFGPIVRAISLVLTAVALAYCLYLGWLSIQPNQTTAIYLLNASNDEFTASPYSGALFLDESVNQLDSENENLSPRLRNLDRETNSLGPQRNTALFYLYGDLATGAEGELMISQNEVNGNRFEQKVWLPLGERFKRICEATIKKTDVPVNRIVLLDIGDVDEGVRSAKFPLSARVKSLLGDLKSNEVANHGQLWVILSADGGQHSWYAPELGSSVFSFFVSNGLAGWATASKENEISLEQLFAFVENSVANWARDYRDSTQVPVLISLNDRATASNISVIFSSREPERPSSKIGDYRKAESNGLWEKLTEIKKTRSYLPHQIAMIESRLVRLEESRYGSTTGTDNRSSKIFDKLKLEIEYLIGSLPGLSNDSPKPVSLALLPASDLLTGTAHVAELKKFLFPPPAETPPVDGAKAGATDPENPDEAGQVQAPATLSEQLKKLNKTNRIHLVWKYLGSVDAASDPLTGQHFKECIDFIQKGEGSSGLQLKGKPVDLVEFRFLKILNDNIDWSPGLSNQKDTVLASIRCRQLSESIIQGSDMDSNRHARAWPLVRETFEQLEARRRKAEDAMLANQVDKSQTELRELIIAYQSLANDLTSFMELRTIAQQAIQITPYLRLFLARESRFRETSPEVEKQLASVMSIERLAIESLVAFQSKSLDAAACKDRLQALGELDDLRKYFRDIFLQRLVDDQQSASDVVFQGWNLLASPIPEWIAEGGDSQRAKIRSNVDKWILKQRTSLIENWKSFVEKNAMPSAKQTIGPENHELIAGSALQKDFDQLKFNRQSEFDLTSFGSVGDHLAEFQPGNSVFSAHFNQKKEPLESLHALAQLQGIFETIDFKIRVQNQILSNRDQPLDVGEPLLAIDQTVLSSDRLKRSVRDFWGDGDVEKIVDRAESPPFIKYTMVGREEIDSRLAELAGFKSRSDQEKVAFEITGLRQAFDQQVEDANEVWNRLQATSLIWPDRPADFAPGSSVDVATAIETEFMPEDVSDSDSLVMATKLLVNKISLSPLEPMEFSLSEPAIHQDAVPSNLLKRSNELESIVNFRGHRFVQAFRINERKIEKPTIIHYRSNHVKLVPGESQVQVINNAEHRADIVFILDCSSSMVDRKIPTRKSEDGADVEATRFEFAKVALETALRELFAEERFRFSLYAFGHRAAFKKSKSIRNPGTMVLIADKKTGRYPLDSDSGKFHPFDDCEPLFRLSDSRGDHVATAGDRDTIIGKIGQLKARGVTPLYYSIAEAAKEFSGPIEQRKRYIVVLTDGANNQIHNKKVAGSAGLPAGKTLEDETTVAQVRRVVADRGIELLVARISKSGNDRDANLTAAGAHVLPVLESDSAKISDAILEKIGRSEFSLTKKGTSPGDKLKIAPRNSSTTKERGSFVVETFGVTHPDTFEVELEGDETVFLENTRQGLVLVDPDPKFLPDQDGNGKVTTDLGPGRTYDIGRIKPKIGELAFGFNKIVNVAGSASRNFSFRPQRVWAQVTDAKTRTSTNLFLPVYDPGKYPVARFKLPPKLLETSESVDVRIWVTPNHRDGWPMVSDPMKTNPIPPNENTIGGIQCLRREDETGAKHTITIEPGDDPRGFFINCPDHHGFTRVVTYANGVRKKEVYVFKVPRSRANFSLSVTPLDDYNSIMESLKNAGAQRVGKAKDPIFGDDALWVDFQNVKIR